MAEQYTPEEIAQIFEAYNDAIQKNIPIGKDLAQQMKDATLGVKNYSQQMQSSLKQLGTSFKNLGSNIAKGEKGASVFNDVMSSGADHVYQFSRRFGPAGKAVGQFTQVVAAYVGAVNKQADALFKSYKDISRAGVIGAGGMQEVYTNMQRFGYTINELGEFGTLMKSNSEVLAKFGGTAFNGAEQFANLADEIQQGEIGKRLMLMGVSVDEINKGAAGFLKQQTMMGRNAAGMQKTLAAETAKYLENLEAVSRITGQDRSQLEQKQQDAMAEQQFAAKIDELRRQELAGDKEAGKQREKLEMLNLMTEGEQRMNIIRSFAGDVAASGNLFTAMPGVFEKMQDTGADYADVLAVMSKNVQRNTVDMSRAYQLGFGNETFGNITEQLKFRAQYEGKSADEIRAMGEAARKNSETNEKATKNQVEIERAQRNASNSLQDFINLGINPVTKLMSILADVIEGLTDMLPGAGRARERAKEAELNRQGKTSARQDQAAATQGSAQSQMAAATGAGPVELPPEDQAALDALMKKRAADRAAGKAVPGDENYVPAPSAPTGSAPAAPSAPTGSAPSVFTGESLSGLNDSLVNSLTQAATEYNSITGKTIKVTSGKRSREEQAELYQKYMSGQSKFPAAPPGRSKHELGNSVDVSQRDADALAGMGLLSKYGLGRPVAGDPVHIEKISAADGAILSGPKSGYQPNLTMHGTEAVVPLPDGRSIPVSSNADSSGMMSAQLDKLDELISVMKSQLSVSNKLLSYSS